MTTRRVEIPPYSFSVRSDGRGTPIVLLHGLSGSARWWDRNFDALAKGHAVAAVELVGFGGNRRFFGSPLPLPFDESVALLARWLEAEWSEPVHLVGHSMGGQLAIELAARIPERVRSLTLVSSSGIPFAMHPRAHVRALLHQPSAVVSFGPRLALDAFRAGPGSLALASMRLLVRDSRGAMEKIAAPALLIWGDSDPLIPLEYAEAIREKIPHADLVVLERAGHVAMWDQPEAFDEVLLRFIAEVEEGARGAARMRIGAKPEFAWAIEGREEGICWRASVGAPRVVLVHGLGIGTRYFRRLAAALHAAGIEAAAPDLPGIGCSDELEDADHAAVAQRLLAWAEAAGIADDAVWIGHSTGCQIVDAVRRASPVPPRAIYVAPVWTRKPLPLLRLPSLLALDGLREPWALVAEAVRAYWEAGAIRIIAQVGAARRDLRAAAVGPESALAIAGTRDRLVDRARLAEMRIPLREIPGGHGVIWSHPTELAAVIRDFL
jgi:pimeloyl-ACP methyl ester carboxylesterase